MKKLIASFAVLLAVSVAIFSNYAQAGKPSHHNFRQLGLAILNYQNYYRELEVGDLTPEEAEFLEDELERLDFEIMVLEMDREERVLLEDSLSDEELLLYYDIVLRLQQ